MSKRSRSILYGLSLVAAAVLCLAGQPLAAQGTQQTTEISAAARDASPVTPALATEAAARVGVTRAKADANAPAAAQMTTDPTMRWVLIIGIAALAVVLILALAD
jgi:hypothetical protein